MTIFIDYLNLIRLSPKINANIEPGVVIIFSYSGNSVINIQLAITKSINNTITL